MTSEVRAVRSWATEPEFYEAPWPRVNGLRPAPYQLAGVEYRLGRQNGAFGDEPGLGKTIECILVSNATQAKRTLVLCPASLRLNWEREIWRWSNLENVQTYPVLSAKDGVSLVSDYLILSYDSLRNNSIYSALMEGLWDHLIFDEAHYLKDPKGNMRTARSLGGRRWNKKEREWDTYKGIVSRCGMVTCATGTPMPNQPIEIYNMARLLDWDSISRMTLNEFREYFYVEEDGWVFGPVTKVTAEGSYTVRERHRARVRTKPRRTKELQQRMRGNWMVRRLKSQVLPQLPSQRWTLFPLEDDASIRKAFRHGGWKVLKSLLEMSGEDFDPTAAIDGQVATARRLVGEAKAPAIAQYCHELLSNANKLVVCAWHTSVLDILGEQLARYSVVRMDGKTPPGLKQMMVDKFQDPGSKVRVILGQMQPLGMGWTLTEAQDVVFGEPDWVPGVNQQMLDRVHRIGQKGSHAIGHIPYVPGTIEEVILHRVTQKSSVIHSALDETYDGG